MESLYIEIVHLIPAQSLYRVFVWFDLYAIPTKLWGDTTGSVAITSP